MQTEGYNSNFSGSQLDDILSSVKDKANSANVYTKKEIDDKVMSSTSIVTGNEHKIGVFEYDGKKYDIFEKTIQLDDLPILKNATKEFVIYDSPIGHNLYLNSHISSVINNDGFVQDQYKIVSVKKNEKFEMVMTIQSLEDQTGTVKGLVTIQYVKDILSFESFELNIPISELGISNISEVSITNPILKYNKKMAYSYSMDDGKAGCYDFFFKYVLENKLSYTDGCGNNILFSFGNAWVTYNYLGIDLHNNVNQTNGMLWSNLIRMLDFGGGVFNHGGGVYDDPSKDKTDELAFESLNVNSNAIQSKTNRFPFCVVIPGGSADYMQPFKDVAKREEDTIYSYISASFNNFLIDPSTLSLGRFVHARTNLDTLLMNNDLDGIKTRFNEAYNAHEKVLFYTFSHTPGRPDIESDQQIATNTVYPFLNYLCDTYGSKGLDNLWVASCDEIYEYIFTMQNSQIETIINEDKLIIKVKMGVLPGFIRKDMSFLIKSTNPDINKNIGVSSNVTFIDHGKSDDDHILVNISLSSERIRLVEKFVGQYEANANNNTLYEANYMVNQIKQSLRQPYTDRIQAATTSPTLNSITIDDGKNITNQKEVSVAFNVIAPITHYKISESSDLSTVEYISGSSKTVSYTLSDGYGDKTIYVQVKNDMGESEVKSAQTSYQEKVVTYHTVTASVNESDYGSVSPITQQIEDGQNAVVAATSSEGYVIESWTGADEFTGINGHLGTATVKNVTANKDIVCNFKKAVTTTNTLISLGYDHTSSIPANTSMYDSENKITKIRTTIDASETTYDIYDRAGNKSCVMIMNGLIFGNETYQGNQTGDESGIYPDIVLKNINYKKGATEKAYIKINDLVPGKYKFKILINTKKTFDLSKADYELVADTTQKFTLKTSYVDNLFSTEELTVDVSGQVALNISTTDTKNNVLLLNAIEIEKIN